MYGGGGVPFLQEAQAHQHTIITLYTYKYKHYRDPYNLLEYVLEHKTLLQKNSCALTKILSCNKSVTTFKN
jgi:hypothetical protein